MYHAKLTSVVNTKQLLFDEQFSSIFLVEFVNNNDIHLLHWHAVGSSVKPLLNDLFFYSDLYHLKEI